MNNPTHLADVLNSFLLNACACLEDTPYGAPKDCFISHGEPPDDCCDFLAVWVERIMPSHGFAQGEFQTGGRIWSKCCDLNAVADISIRLVRPCYPTLIDDPFSPFPDPADVQEAAVKLAIDIWMLQCCLTAAQCAGVLFPAGANCLELGVGDAVPHGPKGGCAGWTWGLAVELDVCC